VPVPNGPLQLPPPPQLAALVGGFCVLGLVAWSLLQAPPPVVAPTPAVTSVAAPAAANRAVTLPAADRLLGLLPAPTPLRVAGQTLQSWPPQRGGNGAVLWLVPVGEAEDSALPLVAALWGQRDAGHVIIPLPAAASPAEIDALLDETRNALATAWPLPPKRLAAVGARSGADAALRFLGRHANATTAVTMPPRRIGADAPTNKLALILAPFEQAPATRGQFAATPLVQVRPLARQRGPLQDDWTILLAQRAEVVGWLVATLGPVQ